MPYMVTFTINTPQMLPYMAYMDPMGLGFQSTKHVTLNPLSHVFKQEKTWQKWGEPMLR